MRGQTTISPANVQTATIQAAGAAHRLTIRSPPVMAGPIITVRRVIRAEIIRATPAHPVIVREVWTSITMKCLATMGIVRNVTQTAVNTTDHKKRNLGETAVSPKFLTQQALIFSLSTIYFLGL